MNIENYFKMIREEVDKQYGLAREAKKAGVDPVSDVETPIATSLAEKAIGLISSVYPQLNDKRIVDRILELEKEHGQLDTAVPFKIAEEIAKEKFCKFESLLQAMEAGIRVGFSYITLGVVSSPIEGFTDLKVGRTRDGKEYLKAYFSGPIRSAGTTASCVVLMLIDYLRENFGYAKYDPSEEEVKRYVRENYDYHERVTNLQYLQTEEEITFLAKNLPIQISGEPTEQREVSNYKDLDRVESNFIRGGMCLIFSEGLAQKAQKGLRLLKGVQNKGFKATGWDFLEEYVEIKNKREKGKTDDKPTYIKDLVAGRPVFAHPSASGAFRFRYGRCRTNGFSAAAVHPATMAISGGFISSGTQLKIEKPTKGCVVSSCDEMDGPIVKLKDGSVRKVKTFEEGKELYKNVEEIVYLGDLMFSFGDVLNRNYKMLKQGYVEEWCELELKSKGFDGKLDKFKVGFDEAVSLSRKFGIALHPSFIFYWREISMEEFLGLLDWLSRGVFGEKILDLPWAKSERERFVKGKRALELLGVEHKVSLDNVVLEKETYRTLLFNLGIEIERGLEEEVDRVSREIKGKGENILEIVNALCSVKIRDKTGTFIGARMGRPEKAKLRKLTGSPHVLFPVGEEGGRLRSFQAAYNLGSVKSEFPLFFCDKCKEDTVYPKCEKCGEQCRKKNYCRVCDREYDGKCPEHGGNGFKERRIDIRHFFDKAKKISQTRQDELLVVKGIRGTSSSDHSCENLAKGMLRAKYNLHVNKDGTIRYDMTEMILTHFKPKEIGTSVSKLRELGYEEDIYGNKLENDEQILELFPHDVVLPVCPDSQDEKADDVFFKISKFIDDELEFLYGQKRFFKYEKKEDTLGAFLVCIAPHICTATVARLIGFSKTQSLMASPFMHAAMRRDADGDEAAAFLLMDLLLNFSKKFLPAHRGGTQDAPLVLNTQIRAGDVDDQILDFETGEYGLGLYEAAELGKHSSEVHVENIRTRLKEGKNPFVNSVFTHGTNNFNAGATTTAYKLLPTMQEKVDKQMELCKKIRAVDTADVARLVIERHWIRDTRGNLRKFSMQGFRCVSCNSKYRRPPLVGKCTKCGGKIIFTISEGSILKYMQPALNLAKEYGVSPYLLESLELTQMYIESIFGKERERQEKIGKWF